MFLLALSIAFSDTASDEANKLNENYFKTIPNINNINKLTGSRKEDLYINLPVTKTEVERIKAILFNQYKKLTT